MHYLTMGAIFARRIRGWMSGYGITSPLEWSILFSTTTMRIHELGSIIMSYGHGKIFEKSRQATRILLVPTLMRDILNITTGMKYSKTKSPVGSGMSPKTDGKHAFALMNVTFFPLTIS